LGPPFLKKWTGYAALSAFAHFTVPALQPLQNAAF
jgi:hypothetical protein